MVTKTLVSSIVLIHIKIIKKRITYNSINTKATSINTEAFKMYIEHNYNTKFININK